MSDALVLISDLLRCLIDPNNGVALVSTLRNRLFGISDQELFETVSSGVDLRSLLIADQLLPEKVARSVDMLKRARQTMLDLPPSEAFEQIAGILGLADAMRMAEEPELATGMLLKVRVLLRDWQRQNLTFGHCVEELELYRRETLKLETFLRDTIPILPHNVRTSSSDAANP